MTNLKRIDTYEEPKVVNIPIRLLDDVKNDKLRSQILALSVLIKCDYKDSVLRNVSIKTIQELLHCSFSTAKALFNKVKRNSLFVYNEYTRTLTAKNFKKKYTNKVTTKRGNEAYMVYCYKLEIKDYTLRSLLKEFKMALLKSCINTNERKDKFHRKGTLESNTNLSVSENVLTQSKLAERIGVKSRTSVQRLVKQMEHNGIVSVERAYLKFVTNCVSDEAIAAMHLDRRLKYLYDERTGTLYAAIPNKYSFLKREENERFKNIIFNHEKRQKNYYAEGGIDDYFARYDH